MAYLLRVRLPDRPGSLGALAVALGSVQADILSLDVVERGEGFAIDDLVISMPTTSLPDTVITAAESIAGVAVDTIRPYNDLLDTHRELELIDTVAAAGRDQLQVLADGVPRVLRVGWAIVLGGSDGLARVAASSGAPETRAPSLPWFPVEKATELDGEADWVPESWRDADTALAAAPLGALTLLLGRPGGPAFRPSEVARLGYLAGIVSTVLA